MHERSVAAETPSADRPDLDATRQEKADSTPAALASPLARAAIVNLDVSGFNGVNAGMSYGDAPRVIAGFVPGGNLGLSLDSYRIGLDPEAGAGGLFEFAYGGTYASPHEFAAGSDIAAWAGAWSGASEDTCFRWAGYLGSIRSPAFGPGSFIGFRFSADGVRFRYGWIDVRWTLDVHFLLGSFQILGAAYESDANTAILAGATGVAVPLPGAAGLAACGLPGLARRRRR